VPIFIGRGAPFRNTLASPSSGRAATEQDFREQSTVNVVAGGAMKFVSRMPEMTTARYAAVISTVGFIVSLPQHLEEHDHDPERTNQQQGVRSNILSRDAAIDVKDMTQETGN
jgi:hypothetical protein